MSGLVWVAIPEFPDYAICGNGTVMRITEENNTKPGRILAPSRCGKSRYFAVLLYRNGKRKLCTLHRLVAKAFVPNPENKPQVNHKDGNRANNDFSNLEWVTPSENRKHAFDIGLQMPVRGEQHGMHRINKLRREITSILAGNTTKETFTALPRESIVNK